MVEGGTGGGWRASPGEGPYGFCCPFELAKPSCRVRLVRERAEVRHVTRVDAVAERQLRALEESGHGLLRDVDHVIAEPATVRPALVVAAEHAHAADLPGRCRRERRG